MNQPHEYAAASIGAWAYDIWMHAQAAAVIGVTSRGLFLRAAPDRVLFLSYESQRGPLTITLPPSLLSVPVPQGGFALGLRALSPSAPSPLSLRPHSGGQGVAKQSPALDDLVQFSAHRLFFPSIEVTLSVSEDVIWRAPTPTTPILSPEAIKATLRSIADQIVAQRHVEGFGALLIPLVDRSVYPPDDQTALFETLSSLRALCATQSQQAVDCAIELLGHGRGLTPSGDDCLIGLLLMLNRFPRLNSQAVSGNRLKPVEWLTEFNQRVIQAAYQRTTTLSANLIECAAQGESDERLIAVADGIMTGKPSVAECVECVLDWGSSSGIDALVGMALALTAF